MNVKITYCVPREYLPRAEELKMKIEKNIKGAKVELAKGEKGIFDVIMNGKLIFSKHKEGRFPEAEEILKMVK